MLRSSSTSDVIRASANSSDENPRLSVRKQSFNHELGPGIIVFPACLPAGTLRVEPGISPGMNALIQILILLTGFTAHLIEQQRRLGLLLTS